MLYSVLLPRVTGFNINPALMVHLLNSLGSILARRHFGGAHMPNQVTNYLCNVYNWEINLHIMDSNFIHSQKVSESEKIYKHEAHVVVRLSCNTKFVAMGTKTGATMFGLLAQLVTSSHPRRLLCSASTIESAALEVLSSCGLLEIWKRQRQNTFLLTIFIINFELSVSFWQFSQ